MRLIFVVHSVEINAEMQTNSPVYEKKIQTQTESKIERKKNVLHERFLILRQISQKYEKINSRN